MQSQRVYGTRLFVVFAGMSFLQFIGENKGYYHAIGCKLAHILQCINSNLDLTGSYL